MIIQIRHDSKTLVEADQLKTKDNTCLFIEWQYLQ